MCNSDLTTAITSKAAIHAAARELERVIAERGAVSENDSLKIIQEKMTVVRLLEKYLPGSVSSDDLLNMVKAAMEERGYTPENTLFAQSVCPDEVNHEEGDVTHLFAKYWGEVFHLGGLAGLPYTGKTGFKAFSSHVPKGGHCFVLMAPHIGLDQEGNFGLYSRVGQDKAGSCCGAAVGALKYCETCTDAPNPADHSDDYQMHYIIQQVHKIKETISGMEDKNEQQAHLVTYLHQCANEMLEKIMDTNFGEPESTLVVLTGIQINMPSPFDDCFQPHAFYIIKKDGTREDLVRFLKSS